MWIRIRAAFVEEEPLTAQYLAEVLDDTCQVEVVGSVRNKTPKSITAFAAPGSRGSR
jgi:hypothetical protein